MHRIKLQTPLLLFMLACAEDPSPPLTPDQELKTFELVSGFNIELVASEPLVQEPVVIQFDEDGRLWVVEMRGFMPDIEGNGEALPTGRVSVLFDQNTDGIMDSSIVFVDSLVLPRSLAIVKDGALVAEDQFLWYMEDTNHDLKVDRRIVVDSVYGKKGVVEHSPNGLWRGMDNWYYNAKSTFRYRQERGQWVKQKTEFRGQWGICHDNLGRLYYNYNWSQLHADLVPPNYLSANPNHQPTSGIDYPVAQDRRIFPIRENPAINRGYIEGTLDEHGRLIEFTSACAPFIYRGDLFGNDIAGNAFVCEPTGNLVKQNQISQEGIYPMARNAYPEKEFLASTDERFRPVWLTSGPDGALYIADMYRGIIQHGMYMSPYLKEITIQRKLDQPIHKGRIWRIVPAEKTRPTTRNLSSATVEELVTLLGHDNGWYRDIAQRLLIDRNDPNSIELLKEVALKDPDELAQLHAIWSLEALWLEQPEFFYEVLQQSQAATRVSAMRILDGLSETNPEIADRLAEYLPELGEDATDLQIALTCRVLPDVQKFELLTQIITRYNDLQLFRDAVISSIYKQEFQLLNKLLKHEAWQQYNGSKAITIELLATAIARNKDGEELISLLNLLSEKEIDWQRQAIITGLSFHDSPIDSSAIYIDQAPPFLTNPALVEKYQAELSRISVLFDWPGKPDHHSGVNQVQLADPATITKGRNVYLAVCSSCHGNDGKGLPRFGPPLANSEWVLGNPELLTRILLHGMEGPIQVNGRLYDAPDILPVMPAFASTPAEDLAAVMTYIRQEWGNKADAVKAGTVGRIRVETQGKVTPWSAEELEGYPTSSKEQ